MRPHFLNTPPLPSDVLLSFARGLAVLEVFARSRTALSMADLARRTGLPRATVRRILITLKTLGYAVEYDRKFQLTPKILTLAEGFLATADYPQAIQPVLEEITRRTGESSSFAVLEGTDIIYVARSSEEKLRIMSSSLHVGSTLPAFCTSMGRAIISHLPVTRQKEILAISQLMCHTPHTITDVNRLLEIFVHVKKNGYAFVNQELELGLCSIAIPVFTRSNQVLGAINISTHVLRTDPTQVEEKYLPYLRAASQMVSL